MSQATHDCMTGNGLYIPTIKMVMTWGMVYMIVSTFNHINSDVVIEPTNIIGDLGIEPTNSKGFHQRISPIDIEISMV